jgi:hypothetical protein
LDLKGAFLMDLGIKELGITLIVGAFTLLALEAIIYIFFKRQFTGIFQDKLWLVPASSAETSSNRALGREETKPHAIKALILIGVAFGVGMIAEDLSYKFVDSAQAPLKALPAKVSSIFGEELNKSLGLPSRENSRVRTLIKNLDSDHPDIQPVAIDLAKNKAFSVVESDPQIAHNIEGWIICKSEKKLECGITHQEKEDMERSISDLYYYAKNRSYTVADYYDEMKRIESRRDFSRSISLIACVYILLALGAGLLRLARQSWEGPPEPKRTKLQIGARMLAVSLGLFLIYFFFMWGYERESDEFNKRAFGYYSSMLFTEKHAPSPTQETISPIPR